MLGCVGKLRRRPESEHFFHLAKDGEASDVGFSVDTGGKRADEGECGPGGGVSGGVLTGLRGVAASEG